MPVLPAVPSTTVPFGLSTPRRSASSTIHLAARSFTDPPGFMNSALPRISQPVSSLKDLSRMSGVPPTAPVKPSVTAMEESSNKRPVHDHRSDSGGAADKSIPGRAGEIGEQVLSKDPARP